MKKKFLCELCVMLAITIFLTGCNPMRNEGVKTVCLTRHVYDDVEAVLERWRRYGINALGMDVHIGLSYRFVDIICITSK